jgi:peptide/nickel transport system permease protein
VSIARPDLIEIPAVGRRRSRRPLAVIIAAVVLGVLIAAALFPDLFTGVDPLATATSESQRPPSLEHLFGTDRLGRDVFSRVVHGASLSLSFGFSATLLAVVVAVVIGMAAGLGPGALDQIAMRAMEVALALPELLIALVIIVVLGPGPANVVIAIAIAAVPVYARIVRITTLQVRGSGFIEASTVLGQDRRSIVVGHILPNAIGPLLVLATIGIGTAIIAASALSFLGLGPVSPTPEWGLMLADGRDSLGTAWWIEVFPGPCWSLTLRLK